MVQAVCRSLVLKRWLRTAVRAMIEYVLEPPCRSQFAFWHLHDRLQPSFHRPPDTSIVKIIVKTRMKCQSESSACRHPCRHAFEMARRKPRVNMTATCIIANRGLNMQGLINRRTTDFTMMRNLSIQRQPYESTMKAVAGVAVEAKLERQREGGDENGELQGVATRR
jgi:hypothetical protein